MRMRLLAGPRFRTSELQGDYVGYGVPETIEGGTGQVKPKRALCSAVPASGRPQWRPVKLHEDQGLRCPVLPMGAAAALHPAPDRPTRRRQPIMSGTAPLGGGPDAPGSAAAGDRPSAASDPDAFEAFHLAAASPNHGSVRRSY
jgi:hypothetical protein